MRKRRNGTGTAAEDTVQLALLRLPMTINGINAEFVGN